MNHVIELIEKHERAVKLLSRIAKKIEQGRLNELILDSIHTPGNLHYRDKRYLDQTNKSNKFLCMMQPLLEEAYQELMTGQMIFHEI